MQVDARTAILGKIRGAIGEHSEGPSAQAHSEWKNLPRNYLRSSAYGTERLVHLLIERLRDYEAQVLQSNAGELTGHIAQLLQARAVSRILVPPGIPADLLPDGFEFVLEPGLSAAELNQCHGVLTQSTLAIAETGTIVLQNVPGQGRRAASLIPDYHLCLVNAWQIVATVPEAISQLQLTATLPTTFISGPSATADIEMTRIKGVHGPRLLDVIVVSA